MSPCHGSSSSTSDHSLLPLPSAPARQSEPSALLLHAAPAAAKAQMRAQEEKDKGNAAFTAQDYETAVKHFTTCIELDPRCAGLLGEA